MTQPPRQVERSTAEAFVTRMAQLQEDVRQLTHRFDALLEKSSPPRPAAHVFEAWGGRDGTHQVLDTKARWPDPEPVEPPSPSDLADTVELSWLKYDPRRYGDAAAEVERDETPLWRRSDASTACSFEANYRDLRQQASDFSARLDAALESRRR
jgi:hypothetical protein